MAVAESFKPEYHRQNTTTYCGSACAQMVLSFLGAGLIPQADIKDLSDDNTVEEFWATAPDGLNYVMNNLDPRGTGRFQLVEVNDAITLTRKIIWTLHRYQVAPIALVFGMAHWVVVFGYEGISAYPTSSTDTVYNIDDLVLMVHNPAPPLSGTDGSIIHASNDCDTGRQSITIISGRTWFEEYITGVIGDGADQSRWVGKFIAVCDPEPLSCEKNSLPRFQKKIFEGKEIINPERIADLAMDEFYSKVAQRIPGLKNIAKKNINPGKPVLIKHLGFKNKYYYLTPVMDNNKTIYSIVSNDARYGNFREAGYASQAGSSLLFQQLTKNEIYKILEENFKLSEGASIKFFKNTIVINAMMVWKPCRESLSPLVPFYLVHVGEENFYVRIDGEVFKKLTPAKFGL